MSTILAVSALLLVAGLGWMLLAMRWKRGMNVSDDSRYAAHLATLSEASVRRHFNAYVDVDWEAPEFAVTTDDPRWVLPSTDALGRHPWYQAQPLDRQIAMGRWRHANMAKVAIHFEDILVRGLMHYAFWLPNGSPEFRYCVHESIEECNHTLMFQEMINRIGVDVPGMARWLRWLSPMVPQWAGLVPNAFFFAALAGEVPFDYVQTEVLRADAPAHPAVKKVIAIHVAEEARHIAFGDEILRRRVPRVWWTSRFVLSLFVPIIMAVLGRTMVVPPGKFFREFGIPRSVRRSIFGAPDARQAMRDAFADIRTLCGEVGLMNPVARLVWRICRIDGHPSRYRHEPQRAHLGDDHRPDTRLPHGDSAAPAEKENAGTLT